MRDTFGAIEILVESGVALTAFQKVGLQYTEWFSTVRRVELFWYGHFT